jgi:hypothetical protein
MLLTKLTEPKLPEPLLLSAHV